MWCPPADRGGSRSHARWRTPHPPRCTCSTSGGSPAGDYAGHGRRPDILPALQRRGRTRRPERQLGRGGAQGTNVSFSTLSLPPPGRPSLLCPPAPPPLPPPQNLDRPFIRTSARATIHNLKKFLAAKMQLKGPDDVRAPLPSGLHLLRVARGAGCSRPYLDYFHLAPSRSTSSAAERCWARSTRWSTFFARGGGRTASWCWATVPRLISSCHEPCHGRHRASLDAAATVYKENTVRKARKRASRAWLGCV